MAKLRKSVLHFDRGDLLPARRDPENGNLLFEGRATRAGVFLYRDREGGIRRELRPPGEVGDPESLASLARRDVTNLHPDEFVSEENKDEFSVGILDGEVIWEADFADGFVKVRGVVQKGEAIEDVERGRRELSCGYTADLEDTSGTWVDSEGREHRFDAIQRNIRYNHIALVDRGRAGRSARLRVDSDAVIRVDEGEEDEGFREKDNREENPMKTIRIDGKTYQVEEPAAQRAIDELAGERDDALERADAAEENATELEAKLDAQASDLDEKTKELAEKDEEISSLQKKLDEIDGEDETDEDETRIDYANERFELLSIARELKIDGFDEPTEVKDSNDAIRRAIVESAGGNSERLDDETYVDVYFEVVSSKYWDEKNDGEGDGAAKEKNDGEGGEKPKPVDIFGAKLAGAAKEREDGNGEPTLREVEDQFREEQSSMYLPESART